MANDDIGLWCGLYDWKGFAVVQTALCAALAAAGAHLDGVLACAYHPEGSAPLRLADYVWRKPNPGIILAAGKGMNLDLARSWIVGDEPRDVAAGAAADLAGGTLVTADEGERREAGRFSRARLLVETAANPADAIGTLAESGRLAQLPQS